MYYRISIQFLHLSFLLLFCITEAFSTSSSDTIARPVNLFSPDGTETSKSITLLWDKPIHYKNISSYEIFKDDKYIGTTSKTNFTITGLKPGKTYFFYVKAKNSEGLTSSPSNTIQRCTKSKSKIYNVVKFGAKGDGVTMNTKAIQKAIDACKPGGTVYIPSGTFLSGALFLKSNMTLYIAAGGVLKGSNNIQDYYPLIPTRFEGWEVNSFASLLTAGTLDKSGPYNITNLSIRGEGTIIGGGNDLGRAMTAAEGKRSRGRLICLMNCSNVDIQGLKILNSPCWTIHYTYCKNVTCRDLNIENNSANGDGIDPDSSIDSYIFNCSFSTGDDCIAIKSGKNPEGNVIAKPCENVRISDCEFHKGHSLAIGSELSGGIKNVFIQDCKIGALDDGLRIKTNDFRGGYVEKVVVRDCNLMKILIMTSYKPNNDGDPANELTIIKNLEFSNLDMRNGIIKKPVISVEGFDNPKNYFKNMLFKNIILPEGSNISVKYCDTITFENVLTVKNEKPAYNIINSTNITY